MSVVVSECQWMSVDVSGCQWMSVDVSNSALPVLSPGGTPATFMELDGPLFIYFFLGGRWSV